MNQFAGTRAEREWLSVLKRIAAALERIADQMEGQAQDGDKEDVGGGVSY